MVLRYFTSSLCLLVSAYILLLISCIFLTTNTYLLSSLWLPNILSQDFFQECFPSACHVVWNCVRPSWLHWLGFVCLLLSQGLGVYAELAGMPLLLEHREQRHVHKRCTCVLIRAFEHKCLWSRPERASGPSELELWVNGTGFLWEQYGRALSIACWCLSLCSSIFPLSISRRVLLSPGRPHKVTKTLDVIDENGGHGFRCHLGEGHSRISSST